MIQPVQAQAEPQLLSAAKDVSMQDVEEEKGGQQPDINTNMCRYCNNPISANDEKAGNFGMFTETMCFHSYHVSCFKSYAVKEMLKYKKQG